MKVKVLSAILCVCIVLSTLVFSQLTTVSALSLELTLGCYDSTVSSQIAANNNFVATRIFTREDLPNGTEITIDYGYKYRPEGWVSLDQTNETRPSNKYGTSTVVVDDDWWGDYNYRAFNISKSTETDISGSYESVASHFKITLPSENEEKTIRILAIGNSFSNDAMHYAEQIALAFGYKTEFLSLYYSGCSIQKHLSYYESGESVYEVYRNGEKYRGSVSMKTVLEELDYDYITFQQASTYSATWSSYHTEENPYLIDLYNAVKSHQPNAKYFIHQTWGYDPIRSNEYGYSSPTSHFTAVENCYAQASALLGLPLIKSGKAIQIAKEHNYLVDGRSDLGVENAVYSDQYCHLTNKGDFVAGCAMVETIFDVDVTTKDLTSLFSDANNLCRAAHSAVTGEPIEEDEEEMVYEPTRTMFKYKKSTGWSKCLYKLPQALEADTEYTITIATKFVTGTLNSSNLIFGLYGIDENTSVGNSTSTALNTSGALLRSSDSSATSFTLGANQSYGNYKAYTFTLTADEVANKKFYLGYSFERNDGVEFYISEFSLYKSNDLTKTSLLNIDDYTTDVEGWCGPYGTSNELGEYVEYNPSYFKTAFHINMNTSTSTEKLGLRLPANTIKAGKKYTISFDYYFKNRGLDYGVITALYGMNTDSGKNLQSNAYTLRVYNVSESGVSGSKLAAFTDITGNVRKSTQGKASYSFTVTDGVDLFNYYYVGFYLKKDSSWTSSPNFYIANFKLTEEGSDVNLLPSSEYTTSLSVGSYAWRETVGYVGNSGTGFNCAYVPAYTGDANMNGEFDICDLVKTNTDAIGGTYNLFADTNVDNNLDSKDVKNIRYQLLGLGIVVPNEKPKDQDTPPFEIIPSGNITGIKTASKAITQTILPGEKVTYTVKLTNNEETEQAAVLFEKIPNGIEYVDGDCDIKNGYIAWNGNIGAGETATVSYTLKVSKDYSLCGSILSASNTQVNNSFTTGNNLYIERTAGVEDQHYISNAIRALKDSTYRDIELLNWIYRVAFSKTAETHFGATAEETINSILSGTATAQTLDMVVPTLYGGSAVNSAINGIKGNPCQLVTVNDLIVGDVIFVKSGDVVKNYIYDKGVLVDLSAPMNSVDTQSVLDNLTTSSMFIVLRPTINISRDYIIDEELEELELTPQQEAVVATAESYILRGEKLQYSDIRFGATEETEYRWNAGNRNPEFTSKDYWGYINCAGFTYEAYNTALGVNINGGGYNLWSTKRLATYSKSAGIEAYRFERDAAEIHTEAQKQSIKQEVLEMLQPGDLMVITRGTTGYGHVVLYIGNGTVIHSTGSVYTIDVGESYEPTMRYMRVNDYFFTESSGGYIFYDTTKASDKQVTEFVVVRPLASSSFNVAVPEETQNRLNNLQGIMAQKLSSHNSTVTANRGEQVTFTFDVYNTNDTPKTVKICDTVPANTTYVSGAESIDGNNLSWSVTIPANTRKSVSYTVKVNDDAVYGDYIQTTDSSTVGGVRTICPKVYINRTLSKDEQNKVITAFNTIKESGTSNTGLALVNEIYKAAGLTDGDVFTDTDFVTVTEGNYGTFKIATTIDSKNYYQLNDVGAKYRDMMAPTLYGGRRFYGFSGESRSDRTRLARPQNIMVGDVLVRKISSGAYYAYLHIGNDYYINITNGITTETTTAVKRLELMLSAGTYYAVYRPSFNFN